MISSLSIVIPIFNEEKRILNSLSRVKFFFYKIKKKIKTEFIFVDDGSTDNSLLLLKKFLKKNFIKNKIILLKKNQGKGAALKAGVLNSDYSWILTCDLDMSVPLNEVSKWIKKNYIKKNCELYFGSRNHNKSIINAKIYRKILGNIFKLIIKFFLRIKIRDTQCGFKLYKNKIAKKIFNKLTLVGFEHDLEIVIIARKLKKNIIELPVNWTHKSNSKLNLFIDTFKMVYGIILLSLKLNKNFEMK